MDNPIIESYVYEEGVLRGRGARFYHPHTNTFGTSGHVKYHPESLYDLNLSKYDATARTQEWIVLRHKESLCWVVSCSTGHLG